MKSQEPLNEAMINAANKNNLKAVQNLINQGANVNATESLLGSTALFFAKNKDMAKLLVKNGAIVDYQDEYGQTALFEAAKLKDTDVVDFLVKSGAKVDHQDEFGRTPLFEAVAAKNGNMVRFLLVNGAEVNHVNNEGEAPLFEAVGKENKEMVHLLLANGAKIDHIAKNGLTPLSLAITRRNDDVVKILIESQNQKIVNNNQPIRRSKTVRFENYKKPQIIGQGQEGSKPKYSNLKNPSIQDLIDLNMSLLEQDLKVEQQKFEDSKTRKMEHSSYDNVKKSGETPFKKSKKGNER